MNKNYKSDVYFFFGGVSFPSSLSLFFFLISPNLYSATLELDNLKSVVTFEQSRSFTDVEKLKGTVEIAPTAKVTNPAGSSPSELIKRVYGFGQSDSKQSYDILEKRILVLNNINDVHKLPEGEIKVPDLPKLTSASSVNSSNYIRVFSNIDNRFQNKKYTKFRTKGVDGIFENPIQINAPIKDTITFKRAEVYSTEMAHKLASKAKSLDLEATVQEEMGVQISSESAPCDSYNAKNVIKLELKNRIKNSLLAATSQTDNYLIIVDTGWPSLEEQNNSLKHLRKIFDEVRAVTKTNSQELKKFPESVQKSQFIELSNSHACLIQKSLKELRELDVNNKLKVIFLPMRPGQFKAKEIFQEILQIDHILTNKENDVFNSTTSLKDIELAVAYSEKLFFELDSLNKKWEADDNKVAVYEPIISGLLRIIGAHSKINNITLSSHPNLKAKFWVSYSWSYVKFLAPPSIPYADNFMLFAAAGNDNLDFVNNDRLFARAAVNDRRVAAVMNSDENSGLLTCDSAKYGGIWDKTNEYSPIVSFPGRLYDEKNITCPGTGGGTSFSTPRVAWLTAISEIIRPGEVDWVTKLSSRLSGSRVKSNSDLSASIDINKLLFD